MLVSCRPVADGLDAVVHPDTAADGFARVREHTRPHTGEQRGAERRAFLRLGPLEGDIQDRGDDLQPELAAGPAARYAPGLCLNTQRAQQLERVAQAIGNALESRTRQAPAIVP